MQPDLLLFHLGRFIAPTCRKALSVGAKEAVISPHPTIKGLYHVKLFYYFSVVGRKKKRPRHSPPAAAAA